MTYCLITKPWIPVIDRESKRDRICPADVTGIGDVEFAWGRADLNIATYELLIGLLSVALPVYSRGDWHKRWKSPPSRDELADALAPLIPWFQLDGNGPRFMQDRDELDGDSVAVGNLLINAPGANAARNGTVLFVSDDLNSSMSPAAAAIALFALQAFAPAGGAGHRTSLRGGGPLTTLVQLPGESKRDRTSLWRTLWLNVPQLDNRDDVRIPALADPDSAARIFPWCRTTATSEKKNSSPFEIGTNRAHPIQDLFGMPRRIRLVFAANAEGVSCPITGDVPSVAVTGYQTQNYGINYGSSWRHPLTPYTQKTATTEWLPVHPKSSRYGYKYWSPVLYGRSTFDADGAGRGVSESLASIPSRLRDQRFLVRATGYVMDNMKVLDFLEAQVPWIIMGDDDRQGMLAALARDLVEGADKVASAASGSISKAMGLSRSATLVQAATDSFWARTEQPFRDGLDRFATLTEDADDNAILAALNTIKENWARILRREAVYCFDEAVPPETLFTRVPEHQKRIIDARAGLLRMLSRDKSKAKDQAA